MDQRAEAQIEAIADKDALHRWVDSLPGDACGVVLIEYPDPAGGGWHEFRAFGTPTSAQVLWLMRTHEHQLMRHAERD